MATKTGKRIYRAATTEEKARHAQIREQIQAELPEIEQRGREKLAEAIHQGVEIQHITALLKAERLKQGLSLSDLNERTNIDRSTLSKLESNTDANPTISTLVRYAEAIGKKVVVTLASATE
ncbi:helix-turn-helix transcriptional regulator [Chloroflexi bacterium TSY]|nr:helix-turn-helix transcriptional regulator [Chloroflexi bacterium TSY]